MILIYQAVSVDDRMITYLEEGVPYNSYIENPEMKSFTDIKQNKCRLHIKGNHQAVRHVSKKRTYTMKVMKKEVGTFLRNQIQPRRREDIHACSFLAAFIADMAARIKRDVRSIQR